MKPISNYDTEMNYVIRHHLIRNNITTSIMTILVLERLGTSH